MTLKPLWLSHSSDSQWLSKMVRPSSSKHEVRVKVEPPRPRDTGVQHAQGTGRRIARIGEAYQIVLFALRIQTLECPAIHDDFAARLKVPGARRCR